MLKETVYTQSDYLYNSDTRFREQGHRNAATSSHRAKDYV